jgi:hypothetical protein
MIVRYEHLVADPDRELARVFRFAGLDDHAPGRSVAEGVNRDNFAGDRTPRGGSNQRYFDNWDARRRSPAKRVYLGLAERRCRPEAARFGYAMRPPAERPASDPLVARLLEDGAA